MDRSALLCDLGQNFCDYGSYVLTGVYPGLLNRYCWVRFPDDPFFFLSYG